MTFDRARSGLQARVAIPARQMQRRSTQFELLERRQMLSAAVAPMKLTPVKVQAPVKTVVPTTTPSTLLVPDTDISKAPVKRQLNFTNYQFAAVTATSAPYTPAEITQAYGMNNVLFGNVAGTGAGQTIAIVDAYDDPSIVSSTDAHFVQSDLHQFDLRYGLNDPPSFTKMNQVGSTTSFPAYNAGWSGEIALDVEWAHVMAPQANIVLVEASSASDTNLNAAVTKAKSLGHVVSMSYGGDESDITDSVFSQTGVTFVASAGDDGGVIDYPSSSPNVVGIGGTSLNIDQTTTGSTTTYSYDSETVWTDSGGGVSAVEQKPTYQKLLVAPDTTPSATFRSDPDVSAVADPDTGVIVLDTHASVHKNGFNTDNVTPPSTTSSLFQVGGTSLSAPLWAGMIAVMNQGRASIGLTSLSGNLNYTKSASGTLQRLYSLNAGDFHDITTGTAGSLSANGGYDLITGRGSPIANKLLPDLAGGATISGTVFQDSNTDGTMSGATETGQAGVTVYLDLNNNGTFDSAFEPSTTTDAGGAFSFSDLIGGQTFTLREQTLPTNFITASSSAITATTSFGATTTANIGNFPTVIGGQTFTLQLDSTGTRESIYTTATAIDPATYSIAKNRLSTLTLNATGAADTLNIDLTNGVPIPSGGVTWSGAAAADTLTVTGSASADTVTLNTTNVTFAGALTVAFGAAGNFSINLLGGNDIFNDNYSGSGAVSFDPGTGSDTFNLQAGSYTANTNLGAASSLTIVQSGGTTLHFNSSQTIASLSVPATASAAFNQNGSELLVLGTLSLGGTLNLFDNDLIVKTSTYDAIAQLVASARAGGTWTGTGLTSTAAQGNTNHSTTLAAETDADYASMNGGSTTFDNVSLPAGSVVVKYTYYGDENLDGSVNFDDYTNIDKGYTLGKSGWVNGDLNYSGAVNFDDFSLIDTAFTTQLGVL